MVLKGKYRGTFLGTCTLCWRSGWPATIPRDHIEASLSLALATDLYIKERKSY